MRPFFLIAHACNRYGHEAIQASRLRRRIATASVARMRRRVLMSSRLVILFFLSNIASVSTGPRAIAEVENGFCLEPLPVPRVLFLKRRSYRVPKALREF